MRTVQLLSPLAADLGVEAGARSAAGHRLRVPDAEGHGMVRRALAESRKRVFQPAAKATGLDDLRPYDLRHSFVSLLLSERRSLLEVAKQAGHSPTMALATTAT